MLPGITNTVQNLVVDYKKSFTDALCEGYRFEVKYDKRSAGVRSLFYYDIENTLIVTHILSNRVHLLNLSTGKLRWFDHHNATVRSVLVSNNEVVTASWDGTVCVTDFESLKPRLILTEKEMGRCPDIVITPDHSFVYSYTYDSDKNPGRTSNTIRKWDLLDGKLTNVIQLPGVHLSTRRCGSCKVHDNQLYVVSDTGHLHILDCDFGVLLEELCLYDQLQSVCIIPGFNNLVIAGNEGNIYLCDLYGKIIKQIGKAHKYDVSHLMVHPDKPDVLISASFDGTLKIWKLPDLELINSIDVYRNYLWTAAVAKNMLFTGGDNGDIWIYNAKDLSEIKLKGKLIISDESYAFLSSESNSFYASDLSMMQVRKNDEGAIIEGQFAEYLLNSTNNFKLFKDLFDAENTGPDGFLHKSTGFLQLTQ